MTSEATSATEESLATRRDARRMLIRYTVLTVALFAPLLLSFVLIRNVYPVAAWKVMLLGDEEQRAHEYFILRGETVTGETIDIAPANITGGSAVRAWWMVGATVDNKNFKLRSLHPENARLLVEVGGLARLPRGARVPVLLRVWGEIYNEQEPENSPRRLRAIHLDAYRWDGVRFDDYGQFVESWREEL